MDIRKLQRAIVDGLEDVKAQNIVVFNTEHLSPLFERVIIASGTSNRQTKALAASVRDAVKAAGDPPPRVEGEENGEWIIVDCGSAVVHVMQPAFRDYYHLEELWGEKPVRMKMSGPSTMPARPSLAPPPHDVGRRAEPATPGRKAAPRKAAASPSSGSRTTAKKAAAKKAVVRESGRRSTAGAAVPSSAARRAAGGPSARGGGSGARTSARTGTPKSGAGRTGGSRPAAKPQAGPRSASTRKAAPRKGGARG
jgi:ribosome-associated protein